jgi:hypothetical protein
MIGPTRAIYGGSPFFNQTTGSNPFGLTSLTSPWQSIQSTFMFSKICCLHKVSEDYNRIIL